MKILLLYAYFRVEILKKKETEIHMVENNSRNPLYSTVIVILFFRIIYPKQKYQHKSK